MALQLYFQYNDKEYCVEVKSDADYEDLCREVCDIIEIDQFELSYGGTLLCDYSYRTKLADLGICNESKISVVIDEDEDEDENEDEDEDENEDVNKIIEDYDEDTLDAYCEAFGYERSEVEYNQFEDSYFGRFDTKEEFVDYVLEELNGIKNPDWVNINYERTWDNIMVDFSEHNGYYFWDH